VRYAILFSGMTYTRHLNGLEFCYRTLVDTFAFEHDNIFVLNYDKSLRTVDEQEADPTPARWPPCWPLTVSRTACAACSSL